MHWRRYCSAYVVISFLQWKHLQITVCIEYLNFSKQTAETTQKSLWTILWCKWIRAILLKNIGGFYLFFSLLYIFMCVYLLTNQLIEETKKRRKIKACIFISIQRCFLPIKQNDEWTFSDFWEIPEWWLLKPRSDAPSVIDSWSTPALPVLTQTSHWIFQLY